MNVQKVASKNNKNITEKITLNRFNIFRYRHNSPIKKCEYPSDDPIQQVDINNVNISSSIALSKDGAIYELQTK